MNNNQGKEATSLVALVHAGSYQALREMVNRQEVNLDQTDEVLNTPLHVAVATRQHNMAVMLLNRGASIDRKDREGRTALQLARSLGETGEGMVVAIQLTARRRMEEKRREEKRISEEKRKAEERRIADEACSRLLSLPGELQVHHKASCRSYSHDIFYHRFIILILKTS